MKASDSPIIVQNDYAVPPLRLWEAITERNQMIKWFFEDIPEFKPKVGFTTRFAVHSGERTFTHLWDIIEVDPGRSIVYRWRYVEYAGEGRVTFEIAPCSEGSTLTLTNEVVQDFDGTVPEFARDSCRGGWEYFLSGQLSRFLDEA